MTDEDRRDDDLDTIRATYARYEREGRSTLWDRQNQGYRRLAADRDGALLSLIERSAAGRDRPRLLDIGCGTGSLAGLLHVGQPGVEYTGIDLLPERIETARQNAPWAMFTLGSADRLPYADDAYDIVTAVTLFSSVTSESMEAAIAREIARVLRPGGWLIWYDIRYRNLWNPAVHQISRERLAMLFPGWAAELRSFGVAPPLARRMGRLTPILYPTLNALPRTRSHLIGRMRRPDR